MAKTKKKQEAERIPAVIYARYSSERQRDESIEGQIRECSEYARRNGFTIIDTYTDKALTGRTDKRPGFQKMIADSDRHAFQAVICWKNDRFARNRYDAAVYKNKLKKNGVRLFYARESVPDGPEGIILESVIEGMAEYYSANLSQNVKRGMYDSALQFKTLGRRVLGYKTAEDGKFEIDPETAPIVRRIFAEYDSGKRMVDIYEDLNRDGYRTLNGGPFNKSSMRKILKNKKYIGVYEYLDIYSEDAIPAIIDRETFESVQKRLALRQHGPRNRDGARFLLTAKLFCGLCGEPMTGDGGTGKCRRYYYYTCRNSRAHKCTKKRVDKDRIENFVVDTLIRLLMDDEFIETVADLCIKQQEADREKSGLKVIEAKQKDAETRLGNIERAIESGIVTVRLEQRVAELQEEIEQLKIAYAKELMRTPDLEKDQIIFMLEKLRDGDVNDQRYREHLVDTFLNSVYLYDDGHAVIHLNFTGKKNTVSLEYTEKAAAQCSAIEPDSQPSDSHRNTRTLYMYVSDGIATTSAAY